jgi:predicted RNA-binding Zn ribbon-like protein
MTLPNDSSILGADRFPLLGEPFPVEFANTLYNSRESVTDFLATRELFESWFAHAQAASVYRIPPRLANEHFIQVRELRDAIAAICAHLSGGSSNVSEATATLNHYARLLPGYPELQWTNPKSPSLSLRFEGGVNEIFLARLASDAITFFSSPEGLRIRRCATPICTLFFVRQHHRRRFCSEPCSQRTRQSRYYQASK